MDDMEREGGSSKGSGSIAWYEAASKGRLPHGIDLIKEYSNGDWEIVMDGEIKEMKPCEIIDELLNRFCKTMPHADVGESLETLNDFLNEEVESYKKR
jgi:hypothetical protein